MKMKKINFFIINLIIFLIMIFMILPFIYVNFASKWASFKVIPPVPGSTIITQNKSYVEGFTNLEIVYSSEKSLVEIRDWFHNYIYMSPFEGQISGNETSFTSLNYLDTIQFPFEYLFLILYRNIVETVTNSNNIIDYLPDCFNVYITNDKDYIETYNLDSNESVIIVKYCYP